MDRRRLLASIPLWFVAACKSKSQTKKEDAHITTTLSGPELSGDCVIDSKAGGICSSVEKSKPAWKISDSTFTIEALGDKPVNFQVPDGCIISHCEIHLKGNVTLMTTGDSSLIEYCSITQES